MRTRAVFAQSPSGSPVAYGGKPSFSTGLTINGASVGGCIIPASMCARLYSSLIVAALGEWNMSAMTLIEDTSMLWDEYCLIRLSLQYRGRAVPEIVSVIKWTLLQKRSRASSLRFGSCRRTTYFCTPIRLISLP